METVQNIVEQRVVLYGVSWERYERLLAEHLDNSVPHFTYDRVVLAIVSPLPEHQKIKPHDLLTRGFARRSVRC